MSRTTIAALTKQYPGQITVTVTPQHAPGHPMTDTVSAETARKMRQALEAGHRIRVGNAPRRTEGKLAQVNSRYHGKSIRTIHDIGPLNR